MILHSIELGLIFGLLVIGTFLTSKVIKFDDLSIEGSFCIGGAVSAKLLLFNFHPITSIAISIVVGIIAGLITGIIHNKLKVNNLLSGILTVNILFSASLIIASSNVSLMNTKTLFDSFTCFNSLRNIIPIAFLALVALLGTKKLLETQVGLCIQTIGDNKKFLGSIGKSKALYETMALCLSNGLAALAGSLFVQLTGFFSIWSNVGILVSTLASLKIGLLFTKKLNPMILLGGIIFQTIISLTFEFNVMPELQKLISALLVIIFTIALNQKEKSCFQ